MTKESIDAKLKARNPNMEVIEESTFSDDTKIRVKCLKCGHIFNQRTAKRWLYQNAKCYYCDNQPFSKLYETYPDYIKRKTNDRIEPVSEYVNASKRMAYRCKLHNEIFTMSHSELFRDHKINPLCPQCQGRKIQYKSYSQDVLIRMVNENAPNLIIDGEIEGIAKEFNYTCNKCGYSDKVSITRLMRLRKTKTYCPNCNNRRRKSLEQFNIELAKKNSKLYAVSEYISANKPITVKCKVCGYEDSSKNPHGWLNKEAKCYICDSMPYYRKEPYSDYLLRVTEGKIITQDKFINAKTPMNYRCEIHGLTFSQTHDSLFSIKPFRAACPKCKKSAMKSG